MNVKKSITFSLTIHLICIDIVKPSLNEASVSVPVSTSSGAERRVRMSEGYYIDRLFLVRVTGFQNFILKQYIYFLGSHQLSYN